MATHVPKVTVVDGKRKVVYVRTPETLQAMEKIRLGSLYDLPLVESPEVRAMMARPVAVFQADYEIARRVIRTRLDLDRRSHRILNGTRLLHEYFHSNETFRSGFLHLRQLFIVFGYMEIGNKMLHQVLCDTVYMRYEAGEHVWVLIPKPISEMASLWGESFENLRTLPFLHVPLASSPGDLNPVSRGAPLAPPGPPMRSTWRKDPSYPAEGGDLDQETTITAGDFKFAPVEKKKKWGRPDR